jgi:hypothetical protein
LVHELRLRREAPGAPVAKNGRWIEEDDKQASLYHGERGESVHSEDYQFIIVVELDQGGNRPMRGFRGAGKKEKVVLKNPVNSAWVTKLALLHWRWRPGQPQQYLQPHR